MTRFNSLLLFIIGSMDQQQRLGVGSFELNKSEEN